jgi:hypothetical protein
MTIRLRPHHLLCMLTFVREGYTPAFVENLEQVIDRIAAGKEGIEIVEGPDDICAGLLTEGDCHCHNASVVIRDQQAAIAVGELLQQPIHAGTLLQPTDDLLGRLRQAFASGTIRQACTGCQWFSICSQVAGDGFNATRLLSAES